MTMGVCIRVSPMACALGNILHVGIQISITVDLHLSEIVANIATSIYTLAVKRGAGDSIIFGASQIHGRWVAALVLVFSILSSGTRIINTAYTCFTVFAVRSDARPSRVFTGGRSGDPTDAVVVWITNIGRVASQFLRCFKLSNITALELSRGCGAGGALLSLFSAGWCSVWAIARAPALPTCFSIGQGDAYYSTKVRQLDRVGGRLVVGRNSEEEGGKELHVGFDMINYDNSSVLWEWLWHFEKSKVRLLYVSEKRESMILVSSSRWHVPRNERICFPHSVLFFYVPCRTQHVHLRILSDK